LPQAAAVFNRAKSSAFPISYFFSTEAGTESGGAGSDLVHPLEPLV
jgi:hypothetical protein